MTRRGPAKVCVLASGGADSAALLSHYLVRGLEVHPLYVRCGFIWEAAELRHLRRQLRLLAGPRLKALRVVDARGVSRGGRHWSRDGRGVPGEASSWDSVHLPGRNLLLWTCVAGYCLERGISRAAMGTLKGNPFPDSRKGFRSRMSRAIRDSFGIRLVLEAPYEGVRKADVLRGSPVPVEGTISCLRPSHGRACGRCSKCAELRAARGRAA